MPERGAAEATVDSLFLCSLRIGPPVLIASTH